MDASCPAAGTPLALEQFLDGPFNAASASPNLLRVVNPTKELVAAEGVAFKAIADTIGRQLGLPAKSLTPEVAEKHFGALAMFAAGNGPASNEWTRQILGWEPREVGIIADIERREYLG